MFKEEMTLELTVDNIYELMAEFEFQLLNDVMFGKSNESKKLENTGNCE